MDMSLGEQFAGEDLADLAGWQAVPALRLRGAMVPGRDLRTRRAGLLGMQ